MPTRTSYGHGTFSWVELATTNANAAKRFYGTLFNWTFDDMASGPGMTYTMCKLGSQYACALYEMGEAMKGIPPNWASYITVEDVDATTKEAAKNGAKIVREPFDVLDVGRMAIIQDPTGATVCLWTAKTHLGAGVVNEPGALTWNELLTNDVDRAAKFYRDTIGWVTENVDMGEGATYTLLKRPGEQKNKGGMMAIEPHLQGVVPPHWLVYFDVADCDAKSTQVLELGGKVFVPPMDIPKVGRFAVVQDPQGAVFALFQTAH